MSILLMSTTSIPPPPDNPGVEKSVWRRVEKSGVERILLLNVAVHPETSVSLMFTLPQLRREMQPPFPNMVAMVHIVIFDRMMSTRPVRTTLRHPPRAVTGVTVVPTTRYVDAICNPSDNVDFTISRLVVFSTKTHEKWETDMETEKLDVPGSPVYHIGGDKAVRV